MPGISKAGGKQARVVARAVAWLRPKVPKLAAFMDEAEADVPAFMSFPKITGRHPFDQSAPTPQWRDQGTPRRRRHVPDENAMRRLVGALLLEQNDEWSVQCGRYMSLETIAPLSNDPIVKLPDVATA